MKSTFLRGVSFTLMGLLGTCLSHAKTEDTAASQQALKPEIITVAKKEPFNASIIDRSASLLTAHTLDAFDYEEVTIHRSGASFIKIHFSDFSIPKGSKVIVRNPENTEVHTYGSQQRKVNYTVDRAAGDDGVRRFSAMSISGDTAIVEYVPNGSNLPYSIEIDYIMEGFPEEEINQLVGQPQQGTIGAFSTCGVNERRDVQCWADSHPVEFERTRPVNRLLINGNGLCTGWRVGPENHVFTNNHCVESQSEVSNTEFWFDYQRSSCGSGSTSSTVKVTGATMLATDYTLDYTLLSLNNFSSIQSFGYFGLDVREANSQERIYIPQHGSGNPKELSIESDQNSGGLCRIDVVSASGRGSNTDMGYFCDTIGGSSGSPVLAASSNKVIALHHFGGCPNQGVKISRIWPQVASFFNNQIPVGDNDGPAPTPTPTPEPTPTPDCIAGALDLRNVSAYTGTNSGDYSVSADGCTITLTGNIWRITDLGYDIDADTTVSFDFSASGTGEIQGVGFDASSQGDSSRIFRLAGTQNWGLDDFSYTGGGSPQRMTIPVGEFYTGVDMGFVIANDKDSGTANNTVTVSNVVISSDSGPVPTPTPTPPAACIDLEDVVAFSSNNSGDYSASGCAMDLTGNIWRATSETFTITADSVLSFEFSANGNGEIHGIGFDEDDTASGNRIFQLSGSQSWGIEDFSYSGGTQTFEIPVGEYYTGSGFRLILVNDKDSGTENNETSISNVKLTN